MPSHETAAIEKLLARHAAILFLLSMLTGGLAGLSLSGEIPLDGKIALGAHVAALTGSLILLGVAYTTPMLSYGDVGRTRLAWAFIVANYANWAVSTSKSFFHVHGVGLAEGQTANNVVFVLLNIFVVAPTLIGAVAWIRGLMKP